MTPFKSLILFSLLLSFTIPAYSTPVPVANYKAPIKVICVGDSITEGSMLKNPNAENYPAQLRLLLGDKWTVLGLGVGGTTMLKAGDHPYVSTGAYTQALASQPDVVIIALGTNDSKPYNWSKEKDFDKDYLEMIQAFQALPSKPLIYICIPPFVSPPGNYGIPDKCPAMVAPHIHKLAAKTNSSIIDLCQPLKGHVKNFPDKVHPDVEGASIIAKTIYEALTGSKYKEPAATTPAAAPVATTPDLAPATPTPTPDTTTPAATEAPATNTPAPATN